MSTHTPTPWSASPLRTNDGRDGLSICGNDAKGNRNVPVCVLEESMWSNGPTMAQVHANASFIIHAANHHAELVEALRRAIQHIPANAVNMDIALHSPIADARTLDYCERVLSSATQSPSREHGNHPPLQHAPLTRPLPVGL